MGPITHPKSLGVAFGITFFLAVYGSVLALDGMKEWYPSLVQPITIPLWKFAVVQLVYYGICITILYRLFAYRGEKRTRTRAVSLFVFMMLIAESWNYVFLGRQDLFLGFWGMVLFVVIALAVYIYLRTIDTVSSYVFLPYLLWLFADIAWIFAIWQANT